MREKFLPPSQSLPVTLIYYEACLNKYDALKREKFFKSSPGRRFIKSRLKNYLKYIKKCQGQVRSTVLKALDLKVRFAV